MFRFAEVELEGIQERYIQVMRSYLQQTAPNHPGRLGELLAHIPEVSVPTIRPIGLSLNHIHKFMTNFSPFVITDSSSCKFIARKQNVLCTICAEFSQRSVKRLFNENEETRKGRRTV